MVLFAEDFNSMHQRMLEKYENLREQWVRNGWISYRSRILNLYLPDKSWIFTVRQEEIDIKSDPEEGPKSFSMDMAF